MNRSNRNKIINKGVKGQNRKGQAKNQEQAKVKAKENQNQNSA